MFVWCQCVITLNLDDFLGFKVPPFYKLMCDNRDNIKDPKFKEFNESNKESNHLRNQIQTKYKHWPNLTEVHKIRVPIQYKDFFPGTCLPCLSIILVRRNRILRRSPEPICLTFPWSHRFKCPFNPFHFNIDRVFAIYLHPVSIEPLIILPTHTLIEHTENLITQTILSSNKRLYNRLIYS